MKAKILEEQQKFDNGKKEFDDLTQELKSLQVKEQQELDNAAPALQVGKKLEQELAEIRKAIEAATAQTMESAGFDCY